MLATILNVVYVLLAVAMIVLILMQRGAGAQAGSGFGAGASATVFGSRGAGNFLSKSTKWLAIAFFTISLYMAWSAVNSARRPVVETGTDLGLMTGTVPAAPGTVTNAPAVPVAPSANPVVPTAPAATTTAAPVQTAPVAPATTTSSTQLVVPTPSQGG